MDDSPEIVEIVTTVRTRAEAVGLARTLVRERLAACANLVPCRSIYRWRGDIPEESEVQVALKTLAARAADAERRLRELHPYETPAILRLPVLAASPEYAAWVAESVDAGPSGKTSA